MVKGIRRALLLGAVHFPVHPRLMPQIKATVWVVVPGPKVNVLKALLTGRPVPRIKCSVELAYPSAGRDIESGTLTRPFQLSWSTEEAEPWTHGRLVERGWSLNIAGSPMNGG
jgi:hypothetical protein